MSWFAKNVKPLLQGLGDLSLNCKRASRLQSEALDHELPLRQRLGLRIHLRLCKWCQRYGQQIKFLRSVAHECEHEEQKLPPQTLSAEGRERIKQRLQAMKK